MEGTLGPIVGRCTVLFLIYEYMYYMYYMYLLTLMRPYLHSYTSVTVVYLVYFCDLCKIVLTQLLPQNLLFGPMQFYIQA